MQFKIFEDIYFFLFVFLIFDYGYVSLGVFFYELKIFKCIVLESALPRKLKRVDTYGLSLNLYT